MKNWNEMLKQVPVGKDQALTASQMKANGFDSNILSIAMSGFYKQGYIRRLEIPKAERTGTGANKARYKYYKTGSQANGKRLKNKRFVRGSAEKSPSDPVDQILDGVSALINEVKGLRQYKEDMQKVLANLNKAAK